mmetsp:Transcript_69507/g.137484  ORF Transcript_69507/g.137484 Transcript_69507/m.137484 type:complete len:88 (-) Transcript_69507:384-647(-)
MPVVAAHISTAVSEYIAMEGKEPEFTVCFGSTSAVMLCLSPANDKRQTTIPTLLASEHTLVSSQCSCNQRNIFCFAWWSDVKAQTTS